MSFYTGLWPNAVASPTLSDVPPGTPLDETYEPILRLSLCLPNFLDWPGIAKRRASHDDVARQKLIESRDLRPTL